MAEVARPVVPPHAAGVGGGAPAPAAQGAEEAPDAGAVAAVEEGAAPLGPMDAELAFVRDALGKRRELLLAVGEDWGGECETEEALEGRLGALRAEVEAQGACVWVHARRRAEPPALGDGGGPEGAEGAAAGGAGAEAEPGGWVADVLARRECGRGKAQQVEVRVAVIGNVDSGKSTLVGVLTRSMLDDGRGAARAKVFKLAHEEVSGRTSCIGQHNLCFDASGSVLNDTSFKSTTSGEYVKVASKVVTLVDLAGHERYFKTTAFGLTGHAPDYACLVVGANAGLVGMCKEHLGIALALKVPVFFLVTKLDMAPKPVAEKSIRDLTAVLKKPGVRKKPFIVRSPQDAVRAARLVATDSIAPIFLTSAVDGRGLDYVRLFLNLLQQRQEWWQREAEHTEFVIDETFAVPGVGTVVAGTLKRGVIRQDAKLMLGPDVGDGQFKPTAVKSIHYKRCPVPQVVAGQTAALALKRIKRNQVRKGMVLADERLDPKAVWEFDAEIAILTHSTTLTLHYQAVIHCDIVRQAAKIVAMDRERLRSGDRAAVRFRFLVRPEYINPGVRFVFREGRTKGIGAVLTPALETAA